MEAKLRQLMKHEGVNSTRLAEILGIQASGISHIMSGRNKPSFDFLLKLLQRFPQINPDWLLLDKGPMYRDEIKNKGGQNTPVGMSSRSGTQYGHGGRPGSSEGAGGSGGFEGFGEPGGGVSGTVWQSGGNGSEGWGRPGAVSDINVPYNAGGAGNAGGVVSANAGVASGANDAGIVGSVSGGGARGVGDMGGLRSGELFAPDNNDIIPSGGQSGGYPGGRAGQPEVRQASQHSVYQSGGFTRSASIERIVVFYKDKTFSEYQPE